MTGENLILEETNWEILISKGWIATCTLRIFFGFFYKEEANSRGNFENFLNDETSLLYKIP